jgi:hypothetical protein
MISMRNYISEPNLLLVEGQDEVNFFTRFIDVMDLRNIQVLEFGGSEKFRPNIINLPKLDNFDSVISVGIVRDADTSARNTFTSIQDALRDANLPVPPQPMTLSGDEQRVIVYIMPDNNNNGSLEDLCLRSILEDPTYSCVDEYFNCLYKITGEHHSHESKSRVQVYLAKYSNVNSRLGIAALRNIWNWNHPVYDPLKDFLRQLN